ncbi:hypothetical protein V8G54_030935 [Vigna mungo]|uniref:GRF-type domain-containing protein n=1 Tax=Vigna mungo TaxID=3915 RepID=A0AAQ3MW03_VIGMU
MSMGHSCSSSTCNQCGRKHLHSVSCRGDGSWNRNDGSIICHCGESCVLRTAKTVKNRGKKFWGCRRYKVGSENGGSTTSDGALIGELKKVLAVRCWKQMMRGW